MEVLAIGTDICAISRFKEKLSNKNFLTKIFWQAELDYCFSKTDPAQHLAARFATKEAVFKALMGLVLKIDFKGDLKCIEIKKKEDGSPNVFIHYPEIQNRFQVKVSLSHTPEYALAFAIVSKKYVRK